MGVDVYALRTGGSIHQSDAVRLGAAALADFKIAHDAVIATAGYVWGGLDEGSLSGRSVFTALEALTEVGSSEWSVDQVQVAAVRAEDEFAIRRAAGEFYDEQQLVAFASALAFVVTAARHGLQVEVSC